MNFKERYKYNTETDYLGEGGFSTVYRAYDSLEKHEVALKFFTNTAKKKYNVVEEISKSISLHHENICRYYYVTLLEGTNIHGEKEQVEVGVMEYFDGGNIKTYLASHPEHLDKLLVDVLKGLKYLHTRNPKIIHRDIKPENILIKFEEIPNEEDESNQGTNKKQPVAKIADFGISKVLQANMGRSSEVLGTPAYIAPEQLEPLGFGINKEINTNADIWSFGALAYELITGKMLFEKIEDELTGAIRRILGEDFSDKMAVLPVKYRVLLEQCLVRNANERCKDCSVLIKLITDPPYPDNDTRTIAFPPVGKTVPLVIPEKPVETTLENKQPEKAKEKNMSVQEVTFISVCVVALIGLILVIVLGSQSNKAQKYRDSVAADSSYVSDSTKASYERADTTKPKM